MEVNIIDLLVVFDELLTPPTNEDHGEFWFKTTRSDGILITFYFSIYEADVSVLVQNHLGIAISSLHMKNCSEIRVLDDKKKFIEIVHENSQGRCFLDLEGHRILNYDE